MTILQKIVDRYPDDDILKADGFDESIIGICTKSLRLIYSIEKCVEILIIRDGMSKREAMEYLDFNVIGSYMGEKTPIWCETD